MDLYGWCVRKGGSLDAGHGGRSKSATQAGESGNGWKAAFR